jgi:hypothetical protein
VTCDPPSSALPDPSLEATGAEDRRHESDPGHIVDLCADFAGVGWLTHTRGEEPSAPGRRRNGWARGVTSLSHQFPTNRQARVNSGKEEPSDARYGECYV